MKYRLSKSAANDLAEIWDYTAQTWGDAQAERYLNKLESRFLDLFLPFWSPLLFNPTKENLQEPFQPILRKNDRCHQSASGGKGVKS